MKLVQRTLWRQRGTPAKIAGHPPQTPSPCENLNHLPVTREPTTKSSTLHRQMASTKPQSTCHKNRTPAKTTENQPQARSVCHSHSHSALPQPSIEFQLPKTTHVEMSKSNYPAQGTATHVQKRSRQPRRSDKRNPRGSIWKHCCQLFRSC